jgi:conjugal transfer/entry exclusion protein
MNDKPLYQSAEADKWFDRYVQAVKERDEARREVERLQAERDRLVAALRAVAEAAVALQEGRWLCSSGVNHLQGADEGCPGCQMVRTLAAARAAGALDAKKIPNLPTDGDA